jgi:hypothetical protein
MRREGRFEINRLKSSRRSAKPMGRERMRRVRLSVERLEPRLVCSSATLSGSVFEDLDADGFRDVGEPGIDGWNVVLRATNGDVLAEQTTSSVDRDGDGAIDPVSEVGSYLFSEMAPGSYVLTHAVPRGWQQSFPTSTPVLLESGFPSGRFEPRVNSTGSVRRVPADFPNIQTAIDAAIDGDTVLVSPGTYAEAIDFVGKAITVSSLAGPDTTIIDANSLGRSIVRFESGEGRDSVLHGFTLQRGFGLRLVNSSPTITGNKISRHVGCSGGGLGTSGGSPLIQGNVIAENTRECSPNGAGIHVRGGSPEILGNFIADNTSSYGSYGGGGGIYIDNAVGKPIVRGNVIRGNSAYSGGGIMVTTSALIERNIIDHNHAAYGGGIFLAPITDTQLIGNTLAENPVVDMGGSGLFVQSPHGEVLLVNNIINASHRPAIQCEPNSFMILRFNNVYAVVPYGDNCVDETGLNGNISSDPMFVDHQNPRAYDFRLRPESASLDAGDNEIYEPWAEDIEGQARVLDSNGDGTPVVDLGAHEFSVPGTYAVALPPGEVRSGIDFGVFRPATLGGSILIDRFGDGATPDDIPLTDSTVDLFRDDGNGVLDSTTDELIVNYAVESDGSYRFENLRPAVYFIQPRVPAEFIQTFGGSDGNLYRKVIAISRSNHDVDFGNFATAVLRGRCFVDVTGDGITADDGPAISARMDLFRDNGDGMLDPSTDEQASSVTTDQQGNYSFDGLGPGLYFVRSREIPEVRQTEGGNLGNSYYSIRPMSGADIPDVDFANFLFGPFDFGDAVNRDIGATGQFPTSLAQNGARHIVVPGFQLGDRVDAEDDARLYQAASGDDSDNLNDDDGVPSFQFLVAGRVDSLAITASAPGRLDAWIDFNSDGDWDDQGEQVAANAAWGQGTFPLTIPTPGDATPGWTVGRFRFSSSGGLAPTGPAFDGEVEDTDLFIINPQASGNLTVRQKGSTVNIVGDNSQSVLVISAGRQLGVAGFYGGYGTTVNGQGGDSAGVAFAKVRNLNIRLNGGADLLIVDNTLITGGAGVLALRGQFLLDLGAGEDLAFLSKVAVNRTAIINGGADSDVVFVEDSLFGNNTQITTETGDDLAVFEETTFARSLSFASGPGQDVLGITDSAIGGTFSALMGDDDDQVLIEAGSKPGDATTTFYQPVVIDLGPGNDIAEIGSLVRPGNSIVAARLIHVIGGLGEDVLDAGLLSDPNSHGNIYYEPFVRSGFEIVRS